MVVVTVEYERGSCMLAFDDSKDRDEWLEHIAATLLNNR
jgi:hypothetical protein